MTTLLNKSYRLRLFHVIIVVIVIFMLISYMTRYFEIMRSNIEKIGFNNNLGLIERMITIREAFDQNTSSNCQELKNFDYMHQLTGGGIHLQPLDKNTRSLAPYWTYDPEEQVLTYHILSQQYFHSSIGSKINIKFNCIAGKISLVVSTHQWCKDMGLLKCKTWD